MKLIKYIIYCLIGVERSGYGPPLSLEDEKAGYIFRTIILVMYFVTFVIFEKITYKNHDDCILPAIGITILEVLLVFLLILIFEPYICLG